MSGQLESTITPVTVAPVATPPNFRPVHVKRSEWRAVASGLSWLALAAVVAVVLGELDRLISSVPGSDGRSHSLNIVLTPVALTKTDSWNFWAGGAHYEQVGVWIAASAALDLVLVLALALLAQRLIEFVDSTGRRRWPIRALAVYLLAEWVEDILQFMGGIAVMRGEPGVAGGLGWAVAAFSTAKFLAIVFFIVAILRSAEYRSEIVKRISRLGQAIWVHRLATLAILVIVVLSCIPAADLLDQLPDVQRQWADGDDGLRHAIWAVVALCLTSLVTFVLGRFRTRFLVETRAFGLQRRPASSAGDAALPWLVAPACLLGAAALAAVFALTDGEQAGGNLHLPTFTILLGLTILVPVLAALGYRPKATPEPELPRDRDRARAAWIVGDSLAVLVLVAGALGLVRSFLVPFVLGGDVGVPFAVDWARWVVPLAAAAAVALPYLIAMRRPSRARLARSGLDPNARAFHRYADDAADVSQPAPSELTPRWPGSSVVYVSSLTLPASIALAVALGLLAIGMLWPMQFAHWLGGVAVTLVAISAWVTAFGAFTVIVQSRELIAPFRWLRLKASPVLTLGILLPFAVNLVMSPLSPDQILHAVHVSSGSGTGEDSAPEDPLGDRLRAMQADGCVAPHWGGPPVRPVFLIAAEGGGIRAAFWTASVLATLEGCAARSGFVSSGISGGSVGLAVASTVDVGAPDTSSGPDDPRAAERATMIVEQAKAIAGPDVVSTVVLGLAVGDMFAGGTGVRLPSYVDENANYDDDGWRWRDRAALAEAVWEQEAPGLADRFSNEIDPLTGMLMLSSTDVVSKCRLLVDQAPITEPGSTDVATSAAQSGAASTARGGPCDSVGGMPSMLGFRELPASGGPDATTKCLGSLDWSTAVMLSARFAVVTPTGGLPADPPCDQAASAQFVDGGYVEPTSLAALADTAPLLMAKIAAVNEERTDEQPWLVPVLLYLRNTQGYDLAQDIARAESEPLVPITGAAAKVHLTAEDAWIQRITLAMPSACPDGDDASDCRETLSELIRSGGEIPGGAVVVAPSSTPAVVPPLGWALSKMSQARFTTAIAAAAKCPDPNAAEKPVLTPEPKPDGYVGLDGLATFVGLQLCGQVEAQEMTDGSTD